MSSDLGAMIREAFFSMSPYLSSADLLPVQFISHCHLFAISGRNQHKNAFSSANSLFIVAVIF
jgi:hypothetical protein